MFFFLEKWFRPSKKSEFKGFTLIELLVVIAIIAILAAILFPVFAQAREKARGASCLSNAKQQGTALALYVDDWDEMLPRSYSYGNPENVTNYMSSWTVHNGETVPNGIACMWDYTTPGAFAAWAADSTNNKKIPALYKCPSDPEKNTYTWYCSYWYHAPGVNCDTGGEGPSLAEIESTSECKLIIERGQEVLWQGWPIKGHNGFTPVVFADSHAKTFKIVQPSKWGLNNDNGWPWWIDPNIIW